ncbi:MAG: nucleotidyltransferase family protein [Pseudomonadota bacterium]
MSNRQRPETAFVLAAGLGTRMRPLTETMPKAMVRVDGRPLIDHALDRVAAAGIGRAVVNLHHFAEILERHLGARSTPPGIALADERGLLLDTGGGLAGAAALLGEGPVLALNADAIFAGPEPLPPLLDAWAGAPAFDALLLLVPRAATVGYTRPGDFFLEAEQAAGAIGRPRRRGEAAAAPYVYTGAQVLGPAARAIAAEVGAEAPVFSLNAVWDRLLAADRLGAVVWPVGAGTPAPDARWVDVGTPAGIGEAEAALAAWARGGA